MEEMFKANFEVHIPKDTNVELNKIASARGILKREAIAEAIEQYVARHKVP